MSLEVGVGEEVMSKEIDGNIDMESDDFVIPSNQDEWKIVSRRKAKGLVLSPRMNGNCGIIKKRKME